MNPKDIVDLKTARRCLLFKDVICENDACNNESCPLNKKYEIEIKEVKK